MNKSATLSGNWLATRVAPFLALVSCVLYCFNGELLQALGKAGDGARVSPLFNLTVCHLGGLLYYPVILLRGATPKPFSHEGAAGVLVPKAPMAVRWPRTASLFFCALLLSYNYVWLLSTHFMPIALTNTLFQTSIALVYAVSVFCFNEPLTAPGVIGVLMAVAGSAFASGISSTELSSSSTPTPESGGGTAIGVCCALAAAVGVTLYQVLFRQWFSAFKGDVHFMGCFGMWVSVWHVLAALPLVRVADFMGWEPLLLPRGATAVTGIVVSALIASMVNALYLCIMMWGTPMLFPCSNALSVPLTLLLDVALHGLRPSRIEMFGHSLILLSVVMIMAWSPPPNSMKARLDDRNVV